MGVPVKDRSRKLTLRLLGLHIRLRPARTPPALLNERNKSRLLMSESQKFTNLVVSLTNSDKIYSLH